MKFSALFALGMLALFGAEKKGVVTIDAPGATITVSTSRVGKFEPACPAAICAVYLKVENKGTEPLQLDLSKFFVRMADGKALQWLPPDAAVDLWFSRMAMWIGSRQRGSPVLDNLAGEMRKRILTPGDVPPGSFREGLLYFEGPEKKKPVGATIHLVGLHDRPVPLTW